VRPGVGRATTRPRERARGRGDPAAMAMSPAWSIVSAALALALLPIFLARPAAAQGLAERVRGGEGEVAFRYATRPDVEVCEDGFRVGDSETHFGRWRDGWERRCLEGPAEVVLSVEGGEVRRVELGPPGLRAADVDLGAFPPEEAAAYLLSLAEGASRRVARDALAPAAIADAETWPRMLEIGRDRAMDREVRESALFWVSREAAEVVTRGLSEVALDERDDEEVRKAAVFSISRREADEAVPLLMDIAREAPGRGVRESALFWLARIEDPRVIPFFEQILLGARGGGR